LTGKSDVKYIYPKGKIRPTAEAGFSYFRLFNRSNLLHFEEDAYNEDTRIVDIKDSPDIPAPTLTGFNCGIGVDYRLNNNQSVFCSFSYDNAKTNRNFPIGGLNPNHYLKVGQFKIGYTF